ncbi:hypothetical protein, partial [Deinococcus sp. ME38]|uniref:hypothetical protein n=1 Tax=Deinococcus sp. ME38 TaxID=3400344 RepID=UPI003B58D5A0
PVMYYNTRSSQLFFVFNDPATPEISPLLVVGRVRCVSGTFPILAALIARQPGLFTPDALADLTDDESLHATLDVGRRVALPAGRIRAIPVSYTHLTLPMTSRV